MRRQRCSVWYRSVILVGAVVGAACAAPGAAMAQAAKEPSPGSASTDAVLLISRAGSRDVQPAPAKNFTGIVRVERLFDARDLSHASGGSVAFEPGSRTAWHSHPRGQILIVTAGTGRVQLWGSAPEEIRVGDVVRIPPGRKHWHGAAPRASMTHIAVSEHRDGTAVDWLEPVSDEQYVVPPTPQPAPSKPSGTVQPRIAPGLATLTDDVLFGDVWKRPDLSPRDRSLVTVSVLIATGKSAQLAGHLGRALDNGVKPSETSGLLAHLAIYCGWPSAVSALEVYDQVYTARQVDTAALREPGPRLPAATGDAARANATTKELGAVAPKFVQLTHDVVFEDLWRRSDLGRRDRSLVTIAALAAMGDADQLDPYLRGGIANGLTRAQIAEAVTHLGFYAGWAKATRAMKAVTSSLGN
jgi:4-carboxymuconolactone decarboxylase